MAERLNKGLTAASSPVLGARDAGSASVGGGQRSVESGTAGGVRRTYARLSLSFSFRGRVVCRWATLRAVRFTLPPRVMRCTLRVVRIDPPRAMRCTLRVVRFTPPV